MTGEPDDPISGLTAEMITRKQQVRRAALASTMGLWEDLIGGGIDDANLSTWLRESVPSHRTDLETIALLTDAYIDAFLNAYGLDGIADELDVDAIVAGTRGGTPLPEVLERPFKEARYHLSQGRSWEFATAEARRRLESIVTTNLQQAFRLGMQDRMGATEQVQAYRRVLVGPVNCLTCISASTQRYWKSTLMPIHPGCDCAVEPLPPDTQLRGKTIADDVPTLDAAKQVLRDQGVKSWDRAGMSNVLVDADALKTIRQVPHGELGPILADATHRHRGAPSRWKRRTRREFAPGGRQTRG